MMHRVQREAPINVDAGLSAKRQFAAIGSNEDVGLDQIIVRTAGLDIDNYVTNNPVIERDHDPLRPVARTIWAAKTGNQFEFRGQFPPLGVSPLADETYGLIQAGVLNAVSIGFDPRKVRNITVDGESVTEVLEAVLCEISIVALGALPSALITERSAASAERAKRRALAARYERELRLAGQQVPRTVAPTRSTREGRARLAKLYEMDERFERSQRAFEMRPTRGRR